MICNSSLGPLHDPDGQTGFRTDLHTETATYTAMLDDGPILIPHLKSDGSIPKGTDTHAGAAYTLVYPGITGRPVDLGDAHIDFTQRGFGERLSGTDLHAFVA
jgi:hypothetical protein